MPSIRVDATHFSPDTRAFLDALHHHQVRYLIVGGEAVILHGHVRLTGDVDFYYPTEVDNCRRLFAALKDFWGGDIPNVDSAAELVERGAIFQFGTPPNRIDLINQIDGVTFEEAWPGRIEAEMIVDGRRVVVLYLGVDDLIRNRKASGRPKDLDDLAYLTRRGGADRRP